MQNGCHSSHSIWVMSIAEQYGFEDVFQQAVSLYTLLPVKWCISKHMHHAVSHALLFQQTVVQILCKSQGPKCSKKDQRFQGDVLMQLAAVKGCPKDLLRPEQLSNLRVLTCYGLGAILQHFATWESFPECFQVCLLSCVAFCRTFRRETSLLSSRLSC